MENRGELHERVDVGPNVVAEALPKVSLVTGSCENGSSDPQKKNHQSVGATAAPTTPERRSSAAPSVNERKRRKTSEDDRRGKKKQSKCTTTQEKGWSELFVLSWPESRATYGRSPVTSCVSKVTVIHLCVRVFSVRRRQT